MFCPWSPGKKRNDESGQPQSFRPLPCQLLNTWTRHMPLHFVCPKSTLIHGGMFQPGHGCQFGKLKPELLADHVPSRDQWCAVFSTPLYSWHGNLHGWKIDSLLPASSITRFVDYSVRTECNVVMLKTSEHVSVGDLHGHCSVRIIDYPPKR